MQRLLNKNEKAKIRKQLSDNALLCACKQIFPKMQEEITSINISPEDVFCEAAWLIDELTTPGEGTNVKGLVEELWTDVVSDIMQWTEKSIPLSERNLILSAIFRLVATAFALHHHTYYSDTLRDALLAVIEDQHLQPKDILELQHQKKRQEDMTVIIVGCADFLNEWVNEFIDTPESHLTDDIQKALNKKTSLKIQTPFNGDKKQRKKHDYSRYSFRLTGTGRFKGKEELLLKLLHDELVCKKFIEDFKHVKLKDAISQESDIEGKNQFVFNAVFSGAKIDYHIIWTGTAKELGYFINQLEKRGVLSWEKGPKKWQVTRNRIWQRKRVKDMAEESDSPEHGYVYEPFSKKAFNGSLVPKDTTELDKILDFIARSPEQNTDSDIEDDFRKNANYELDNENNRAEKLSNSYRDTTHKAR